MLSYIKVSCSRARICDEKDEPHIYSNIESDNAYRETMDIIY